MGRVSKRKKQSKHAWMKSIDVKRRKIQHAEPDTTTASDEPVPPTHSPPPLSATLVTPTASTSQPSTSHAKESQGKDTEDTSLLSARENLLDMETRDEDVESDDEIVMLTKRRLKSLLSSRCSCPDPAYDYSFKPDAYENTIDMHCTSCNFKNTSKPEAVIAGRQTSKILRTNISLTYLSVIDDVGFAGMRRMMGALGMLDHNFGYQKACLLTAFNIKSKALRKSLTAQDKDRRRHSQAQRKPKPEKKEEASANYVSGGI